MLLPHMSSAARVNETLTHDEIKSFHEAASFKIK